MQIIQNSKTGSVFTIGSAFRIKIFLAILLYALFFALLFALLFVLLFSLPVGSTSPSQDQQFLFIHLDGISYDLFQQELEAGRMPEIQAYFREEGNILYGQTYFPPLTPVVVSRIKDGIAAGEGKVVSWEGYNSDKHIPVAKSDMRAIKAESMSRRGRTNMAYGNQVISGMDMELEQLKFLDRFLVPALARLAGPALLNVESLLEKYGVVDYYWYSTDSFAHVFGREAQIAKLQEFDSYFGLLAERLAPDINIVIYSDHGMSFGEHSRPEKVVAATAGENLLKYSYPNIYLAEEASIPKLAERLAAEDSIFMAFYRKDNSVVGYYTEGTVKFKSTQSYKEEIIKEPKIEEQKIKEQMIEDQMIEDQMIEDHQIEEHKIEQHKIKEEKIEEQKIEKRKIEKEIIEEEKIAYTYSESDPFAYYAKGYDGSPLSSQEWLELTYNWQYPAVPVSLSSFMANPDAGDIVIAVAPAEGTDNCGPEDHDLGGQEHLDGQPVKNLQDNLKHHLGEHRSLERIDMSVPVAVSGPALKHLYSREFIWLAELIDEIPALQPEDFHRAPERDLNSLNFSFNPGAIAALPGSGENEDQSPFSLQLMLSPAYRTRLGISAEPLEPEIKNIWAEYDIFSTYISRLWLGASYLMIDDLSGPGIRACYEAQLGRFGFNLAAHISPAARSISHSFSYRLNPGTALKLKDFNSIGLSYRW